MLSTSALCRFIHKDVKKNTHALSDHYPNYIRPKVKTSYFLWFTPYFYVIFKLQIIISKNNI